MPFDVVVRFHAVEPVDVADFAAQNFEVVVSGIVDVGWLAGFAASDSVSAACFAASSVEPGQHFAAVCEAVVPVGSGVAAGVWVGRP